MTIQIHETLTEHVGPIDELTPYSDHEPNPRQGDIGQIIVSLRRNGQYRPIIVNKRRDAKTHMHILAGNHTWRAMKQEGCGEIARTFVSVDDGAARRIMLADNRTNDLATMDESALAALLGAIHEAEGEDGLLGTGYGGDDLAGLLADLEPKGDTEPSEPPAESRTKPGDLWVLGEHRLLCGDATEGESYERLLDGGVAQMVFTDPPYGVDYVGGAKPRKPLDGDMRGNDVYLDSLPLMVGHAAPQAAFYIWYADLSIAAAAAAAAGLQVRGQIVWVKNNAQFVNNAHYHGKHEPCIYASLPDRAAHWFGPKNEVTVWEYDRAQANDFHPTQKPIELAARAMSNSTQHRDAVLDPFAGSGSTLIACENLGRRCFAMEIDPGYCDVIVDRWERHTGRTAKLNGT